MAHTALWDKEVVEVDEVFEVTELDDLSGAVRQQGQQQQEAEVVPVAEFPSCGNTFTEAEYVKGDDRKEEKVRCGKKRLAVVAGIGVLLLLAITLHMTLMGAGGASEEKQPSVTIIANYVELHKNPSSGSLEGTLTAQAKLDPPDPTSAFRWSREDEGSVLGGGGGEGWEVKIAPPYNNLTLLVEAALGSGEVLRATQKVSYFAFQESLVVLECATCEINCGTGNADCVEVVTLCEEDSRVVEDAVVWAMPCYHVGRVTNLQGWTFTLRFANASEIFEEVAASGPLVPVTDVEASSRRAVAASDNPRHYTKKFIKKVNVTSWFTVEAGAEFDMRLNVDYKLSWGRLKEFKVWMSRRDLRPGWRRG